MVNGEYFLRASTTIEENMDVAAHFEDMKEGFDDILYEHYLMGYDETIVMIDGWYYDETCTQKINFSTLSFEEYLALETVYGKFSMADGYALIVESYERIYDHSEAYQVVFTRGLSEDRNSSIRLYEIGEGNTNIYDRGGYDHMTVNGVECESFTYESGTVYIVVLKEKITDEDRSIFEWFI